MGLLNLCGAWLVRSPEKHFRCSRRMRQVAEIVHLLGYSIDSLTGARVMNRLGIPISDDTVLQQSKPISPL